ncbi:MAG: TetR/AcrR family transcriptional regulator [Frondihabitans sp.]|nr:TetR/AcrR family transcriptional regulator [Frondihabitans sp.]
MRGEGGDDQRRRGRRPSSESEPGARSDIIAAARHAFGEKGYDGVSLRAVARGAGVDPALVHHYFADKADLFAATLDIPMRPDRIVDEILRGPREAIGANLARTLLTLFEQPAVRTAVLALVRTALGHEFAARMLRQFLLREVLHRIAVTLDLPEGELRASLAASQIVGLIVARYGIQLSPLAEASTEEIVEWVGPVLQWYLIGGGSGPSDS